MAEGGKVRQGLEVAQGGTVGWKQGGSLFHEALMGENSLPLFWLTYIGIPIFLFVVLDLTYTYLLQTNEQSASPPAENPRSL